MRRRSSSRSRSGRAASFGVLCFIGLTMLIYRRVFDPRIRHTSHRTDIAILVILWVQLVVGLITLPFSWAHSDGSTMLILADWAQRIVTLRHVDAEALAALPWPYLFHLVLGHDDLPAVPVQPAGARVERLRHGRATCSAPTRWCAAGA